MNDDSGFLQAIRDNPDDDAHRLVYADWLQERGDPRGEDLRLECELLRIRARLDELRLQVDQEWRRQVVSSWCVVLDSLHADSTPQVTRALSEVTGVGLAEAQALTATLPVVVGGCLGFDLAERMAERFRNFGEVRVLPFRGFRVMLADSPSHSRAEAMWAVREALGCGVQEASSLVSLKPSLLKVCRTNREVEALRARLPHDFVIGVELMEDPRSDNPLTRLRD